MKILIVLKFTIWLYRLASMTSRLATSVVKSWHLKLKIVLFVWRFQFLQFEIFSIWLRGVIKKFSAWPSSVENKIKIVLAYCLAQRGGAHNGFDQNRWSFVS